LETKHTAKEKHQDKRDKALLASFRLRIELPDDVKHELERCADQRSYIMDSLLRADPDAVATHYCYSFMQASMADILPSEPTPIFKPAEKQWGMNGPPPEVIAMSDTYTTLVRDTWRQSRFYETAQSFLREALTVPIVWCKLSWYEDVERSPIGARRFDSTMDVLQRYRRLYDEFKGDEFGKDDADYARLERLSESLRISVLENLDISVRQDPAGLGDERLVAAERIAKAKLIDPLDVPLPEPYQGVNFDLFEAEDVRWDWTVKRYQDWRSCRWLAFRTRMTGSEITERFGLRGEDAEKFCDGDDIKEDTDKFREDVEDNNSANVEDVWEMWDRETRTVYVFTKKLESFLDFYQPTVTVRDWFPCVPFQFNDVAGSFIGLSDVDRMRPLQDEINLRRTNEKKAFKAQLPKLIATPQAFDDDDLTAIRDAEPWEIVRTRTTEDPKNHIFAVPMPRVEMSIFDLGKPMMDLQLMGGRPLAGLGGTQPGVTATQSAFAADQLGNLIGMRSLRFKAFLAEIAHKTAELLTLILPPETVTALAGPAAVWNPSPGEREVGFLDIMTDVEVYLNDDPNKDRMLERLEQIMNIGQMGGMIPNVAPILSRLMNEVLKMGLSPYQLFIPAMQPPGASGPGMGGPPGPAPGSQGHPQEGTPSMASLPGNAQRVQQQVQVASHPPRG